MTHYVAGVSGESFTDRQVHRSQHCDELAEPYRPLANSSVTDEQPRCPSCADGESGSDTCDVVKADGEVCGRSTPCPYHD